jgi:hypothetical protein
VNQLPLVVGIGRCIKAVVAQAENLRLSEFTTSLQAQLQSAVAQQGVILLPSIMDDFVSAFHCFGDMQRSTSDECLNWKSSAVTQA